MCGWITGVLSRAQSRSVIMPHKQTYLDEAAKGKHGSRPQLWLLCIHQLPQALWQTLVQCCSCGLQSHVKQQLGLQMLVLVILNSAQGEEGATTNGTLSGQADSYIQHEAAAFPKIQPIACQVALLVPCHPWVHFPA